MFAVRRCKARTANSTIAGNAGGGGIVCQGQDSFWVIKNKRDHVLRDVDLKKLEKVSSSEGAVQLPNLPGTAREHIIRK
jgi:hypothetical protein